MNILRVGIGLLALGLFSIPAWAADDSKVASSESASPESRIEELEQKLEEALARIEALEADIEKLQQDDAPAVQKTAKPTTRPMKVDPSTGYFPKGAKFTGVFSGKGGTFAVTGEVVRRTAKSVTLRVNNSLGVRDWYVRLNGNKATLITAASVSTPNGKFPAKLSSIDVGGIIGESSLSLSGNWSFKNPNTPVKTADVGLAVKLK